MQEALAGKGFRLLGITKEFQKRGVLPARPGRDGGPDLPKELYTGETREAYVEHLSAFRERTQVTYPFVLAEPKVFQDYPIRGYPTLIIVDADGTVGFVTEGGMKEHMLRLGVERRLPRAEK